MFFCYLAEFVLRQRWLVIGAMACLTGVAVYGYRYQPPPKDEPFNQQEIRRDREEATRRGSQQRPPRLRVATDAFGRRSTDCFLVVEVDNLYTPETVAALRDVVRAVESLEYVEQIIWVDRIPRLNAFGLEDPLLPAPDASPQRYELARQEIHQHPLVQGQLVSADGKTLVMPILFDWLLINSDDDCMKNLLHAARKAADGHRQIDGQIALRIRATGTAPLFLAYREAFKRNELKFQVIAYGLSFLLAVIMFRGVRAVLIVGTAPAMGVFWTLGILNLFGELSNPLTSVVLPVLLTMVGLTDGVHLMVHIRRQRVAGLSPREAAKSAIRKIGPACGLTSLTTAVGFASLMIARSDLVREFGRACALGVLVTFVAIITFIPLICASRLARNIEQGHQQDLFGRRLFNMDWLIGFILTRAKLVTIVGIVATLFFGALALTLRPDDKMKNTQPTNSEAYQALAHCDRALGGIEFARVVVEWSEQVESDSPQIVRVIEEVEALLAEEPLIGRPLSLRTMLAAFPGDGDLASRIGLMELLPLNVKHAFLNDQKRQALVRIRVQDLGIAQYEPVFQRLDERLQALQKKYPQFEFVLDGDPVWRGRRLFEIVSDLAMSLGAASLIIFLVMAAAYRSIRLGLISIIPNLFPLAVTASVLVVLGQPLEIASVCSFTVCLGIAVDDTIHYLTRYRDELSLGVSVDEALRGAFYSVGAALIMTTAILVVGFGTVLTSDLPGHRTFAAMACSTIAAALVGDLIFLPAMLRWFAAVPSNGLPQPDSPITNEITNEIANQIANDGASGRSSPSKSAANRVDHAKDSDEQD